MVLLIGKPWLTGTARRSGFGQWGSVVRPFATDTGYDHAVSGIARSLVGEPNQRGKHAGV